MPSNVEVAQSIDSAVYPSEYRSLLRTQVAKFCCEAALLFLEEDSQPKLSDEAKTDYRRKFLKLNDRWARHLISTVSKCFAPCIGIRVDSALWWLCWEFASTMSNEILSYISAVRNLECIKEFDDGSWSLMPDELPSTDRIAIEAILREGRLDGELVSSVYVEFMGKLVSLHAKQLIFVGLKITEGELQLDELDTQVLNALRSCEFDADQYKRVSDFMTSWADVFKNEGKHAAQEYLREMLGETNGQFDIHGRAIACSSR